MNPHNGYCQYRPGYGFSEGAAGRSHRRAGVTVLGNDGLDTICFCTSPKSAFTVWYQDHPLTSVYIFHDNPDVPYPSKKEVWKIL